MGKLLLFISLRAVRILAKKHKSAELRAVNAKSDVWPGSAAIGRPLTEKIDIRFINHPSPLHGFAQVR